MMPERKFWTFLVSGVGSWCGLLQFEQLIVPILVDLHIVGELRVVTFTTVSGICKGMCIA